MTRKSFGVSRLPIEKNALAAHSQNRCLDRLKTTDLGIIAQLRPLEAFSDMTAPKAGASIFIESDFEDSPVPTVLDFCRLNGVEILSLMSFHENRLRRRDMSIFRFAGRLPKGFIPAMAAAGYRVVSVGE